MKKNSKKQNNKGFSLVELIIVIAIMAILVGTIAPQVITYVEKSRRAKDKQLVDTVFTAVQTAITDSEGATDIDGTLADAVTAYSGITALLPGDMNTDATIATKAKTSDARHGKLYIKYNHSTGVLKVYFGKTDGTEYSDLVVQN